MFYSVNLFLKVSIFSLCSEGDAADEDDTEKGTALSENQPEPEVADGTTSGKFLFPFTSEN